jgi:hypothetical protein
LACGLIDHGAKRQEVEVEFSHKELSLVLFALEGGRLPNIPEDPCEEPHDACPIVEDLEERFGWRRMSDQQKLVQHLGKHLRQGWVECGLLELAPGGPQQFEKVEMLRMQKQLEDWSCRIVLERSDRDLLYEAISKLPRSAWISMPRILWRLKKKLRTL